MFSAIVADKMTLAGWWRERGVIIAMSREDQLPEGDKAVQKEQEADFRTFKIAKTCNRRETKMLFFKLRKLETSIIQGSLSVCHVKYIPLCNVFVPDLIYRQSGFVQSWRVIISLSHCLFAVLMFLIR